MPKVGDKHFSYSSKGKKAAKAYAKKTGQSVGKYEGGGSVDPFSTRNPEGVPATQLKEMLENQNMANEGLPVQNAQERSQASPMGDEVGTGMYKEGGKVNARYNKTWDITDVVAEAGASDPYKDDPAKKGKWKKKYISDLAKKALKGEKKKDHTAEEKLPKAAPEKKGKKGKY